MECLRTAKNNRAIINLYSEMLPLHKVMDSLVTRVSCILIQNNKYFTLILGAHPTINLNLKILELVIFNSS